MRELPIYYGIVRVSFNKPQASTRKFPIFNDNSKSGRIFYKISFYSTIALSVELFCMNVGRESFLNSLFLMRKYSSKSFYCTTHVDFQNWNAFFCLSLFESSIMQAPAVKWKRGYFQYFDVSLRPPATGNKSLINKRHPGMRVEMKSIPLLPRLVLYVALTTLRAYSTHLISCAIDQYHVIRFCRKLSLFLASELDSDCKIAYLTMFSITPFLI